MEITTKTKVEELLASVKSLNDNVKELEVNATKAADQAKANAVAAANFRQGAPVAGNSAMSSDEQKALRYYGCRDARQLLDVNTGDQRFKHVPGDIRQLVLSLKSDVDITRLTAQLFHGDEKDDFLPNGDERITRCKSMPSTRYFKEVLEPRLKAFGSTTSGAGADWVPTAISSQFVQEFELEHTIDQKFKNINMPTNPYKLSVQKGVTKARGIAESATATGTNFGTTTITFSAQKLVEFYPLSEELTEDSAVDILPVARDEVTRAQIRARESGFINGSKIAPHFDSDTAALASNVCEKLFNGLRQIAMANSANGGTYDFANAQVSEAVLRTMRGKGKKYFTNPKMLMWICGTQVYQQLLGLPSVITVDKMGPMATVLNGALAGYQGIPIYCCEYMREDLNATGVYDGTTVNRGEIILVNKERFYVGNRRPIRVRLQQDLPQNDQWLLASYSRVDFEGHAQSATETSVVYGMNVALS